MTRNEFQPTGFSLHSQLSADSVPVVDLRLSVVRLVNDSRYPWVLLVPRIAGIEDIFDLSIADRGLLMEETAMVSQSLKSITNPTKINVGAIGNIVRQLHMHIVARYDHDEAWPDPIWGKGTRKPYEDNGDAFAALLKAEIAATK